MNLITHDISKNLRHIYIIYYAYEFCTPEMEKPTFNASKDLLISAPSIRRCLHKVIRYNTIPYQFIT